MFIVLINFIVAIVGKIVAYVSKHYIAGIGTTLLVLSAYLVLLASLTAAVKALISGISVGMPAELAQGIGMFKPDNFEICLSAILSTKVAVWIFHTKRSFLEYQAMRKHV